MDLPNDWTALLALVFVFGAKHGLDADHLATIDGLTRHNLRQAPARARWCGTLFSLGHGVVVMIVALGVGIASAQWQVPPWMENVGTWISIIFLTVLGLLNFQAVLQTAPDAVVVPVGLKAGLLARLQSASHPLAIAAVGALFALSFDTMSQAALFAVTASRLGGVTHALVLGLTFTGGMLLMDGINGLWIARLLRRADRRARIASRVMGLMVTVISLSVALLGFLRWLSSDIATWYQGRELGFGIGLVVLLTLSFVVVQGLTRPSLATNSIN
ncbi:nickel transporter [Propionivibrio sp.]|uniref:HoxN/HupN/NixA family nickel/cobalt transporter n=2 Tax=Propionivibrio sp. TaxID=2212460 RepID=UPI0025D228F1|nr:nickel transporter [Propionivibrio sp.]MBK7356449.1 nickel transporter [Propionivibrio sp.]MBK8744674.1 nickel transporter [Propionivibrio sp.]MBK8893774.1 nickel transporter [Propionivibrio sp.]